jgi:hypothetical protein
MTITIILVVLAVAFFVFKNKIKEFIQSRIQKKQELQTVAEDFVFLPVGMTRSFNIGITIEEQGGGKARLTISKNSL